MDSIWSAYVRAVIGDDSQTTAEAVTGIAQSTIGRWLRGAKAPTEAAKVAAFAQAYKRNVLEAFVAAGMLDEDDAGRGLPAKSRMFLRSLSDPLVSLDAVASTEVEIEPGLDENE